MAAKFERVELLPLELVDPPRSPLRSFIDPEYIRELAESIRENGLYEPIQVRPVDNRYETVFGHCRYLASRLIGADKIKAIVKPMSDEEVVVARLVENIQREDLGPVDVAKVCGRMRDELGMSYKDIAKRTGKAVSTIEKYFKLLELEVEYQKAVNSKCLAIDGALELHKIDDPDMRKYFFTSAIENGITVEVARFWVENYKKTKAGTFWTDVGGGGSPERGMESQPVYIACGACKGPVEVSQVKTVGLCPECVKELKRG